MGEEEFLGSFGEEFSLWNGFECLKTLHWIGIFVRVGIGIGSIAGSHTGIRSCRAGSASLSPIHTSNTCVHHSLYRQNENPDSASTIPASILFRRISFRREAFLPHDATTLLRHSSKEKSYNPHISYVENHICTQYTLGFLHTKYHLIHMFRSSQLIVV